MSAPLSITEPVAGFFRMKLRSAGVYAAIRIWHGPPHDPVTGEELDRSWRWQAEANGELIEFDRVWPQCAGSPINEAEYRRVIAQRDWAREHAPASAYADASKKVDFLSAATPLPF